ncbi:hypothetical protein GGF50DRAFT_96157, partial [Schizophyllum commune]
RHSLSKWRNNGHPRVVTITLNVLVVINSSRALPCLTANVDAIVPRVPQTPLITYPAADNPPHALDNRGRTR